MQIYMEGKEKKKFRKKIMKIVQVSEVLSLQEVDALQDDRERAQMIERVHVQCKVDHDRRQRERERERERVSVWRGKQEKLEGMSWKYRDKKSYFHLLYSFHLPCKYDGVYV